VNDDPLPLVEGTAPAGALQAYAPELPPEAVNVASVPIVTCQDAGEQASGTGGLFATSEEESLAHALRLSKTDKSIP